MTFKKPFINMQLDDVRSVIVRTVADGLGKMVLTAKEEFQIVADAVLPGLVQTLAKSSAAYRTPGAACLRTIAEKSRFDIKVLYRIYTNTQSRKLMISITPI
jgi:hypothetical protein